MCLHVVEQASWQAADLDTDDVDLEATGMGATVRQRPGLFPFGEDAADFHAVVERHVRAYVDVYYEDDGAVVADAELNDLFHALRFKARSRVPQLTGKHALAAQLARCILLVTGYHNHVGNVADYFADPTFVGAKIRPNAEVADVQVSAAGAPPPPSWWHRVGFGVVAVHFLPLRSIVIHPRLGARRRSRG